MCLRQVLAFEGDLSAAHELIVRVEKTDIHSSYSEISKELSSVDFISIYHSILTSHTAMLQLTQKYICIYKKPKDIKKSCTCTSHILTLLLFQKSNGNAVIFLFFFFFINVKSMRNNCLENVKCLVNLAPSGTASNIQ